jgi:endoglucanase
MLKNHYFFYLLLALLTFFSSCNSDEEGTSLSVDPKEVNFSANGGSSTINIKTTANWSINNPMSDWLVLSIAEGAGSAKVTLTVSTRTVEPRSGVLTVSAGDAEPFEVTVSQSSSDHLFVVSADLTSISFSDQGGSKNLKITTDDAEWSITANGAEWLQLSETSGIKGTTTITVTANQNVSTTARNATLTLTAPDSAPVEIAVTQSKSLYPSYNLSPLAPDASGMSSTAVEIAANMTLGWNIGNTLEAIGGETSWGNPKVSKALIELVKANGFNAIRIPCSWNQYLENSSTAKLKTDWLNRVKEVVGYCVESDVYVILNIHWDGGWLENNCTTEKQAENNAKQRAFWEQIATHLRDYDEHLLFASANEPNVDNATQMSVLKSYHQTFINAVRSTGGRNSYRVLVVQGPSTDIEKTNDLMTSLPVDQAEDRLMAEVHFYTPYQFCLMTEDASWGNMFYYWGAGYHNASDATRNATWGEEATVDANFSSMKTKFIDKGIPVIIGEYAAIRRTNLATADAVTKHLASRAYYLTYVTKQAKANGMIPFYWDAGGMGNHGSALFNRSNNTVFDEQALNAILEGAQ